MVYATYFCVIHAPSCTDIQCNFDIKPPGFSGLYRLGLCIKEAFDNFQDLHVVVNENLLVFNY